MSKPTPPKKKVLLIGWDSADWKIINELLAKGGMNSVRSLMEGGTHGDLATIQPQLSPMQWTSIATGKMAKKHGVQGYTEVDPISGHVVPVTAASRQCKTIWEMLGEHGLRSHLVSWSATHGEKNLNGKMVSEMFSHQKAAVDELIPADFPRPMSGTYCPENLSSDLNARRVSPPEIGEDLLKPFFPADHKINLSSKKHLKKLRKHLAESYSTHSAATHLMESDPDWDFMAVHYRSIQEISNHFMPFHPPRMTGTSREDFETYQHVIEATYNIHDVMLQSLITLAGPDTTIILVSDHGYHSDDLRPKFTPRVCSGNTVWHRDQGVFLAKGPGINNTPEPITGAGLLDITPTILHHFGLPIGDDMDGSVITDAFENQTPPKTTPTWETPGGPVQSRGFLTRREAQIHLEQFVDLGYIEKTTSDLTQAIVETEHENKWNLARTHLFTGHHELAFPLLSECFQAIPDRPDYAQALARTQLQLNLTDEAQGTLDICLKSFGNTFSNNLLRGQIEVQKGNHQAALDQLELIRSLVPNHPQLLEIVCRCSVALKQWDTAEVSANKLLAIDPESFQGHITLARLELHHNANYQGAIHHAFLAADLHPAEPFGHLILGQAYAHLEKFDKAINALNTCLVISPNHTWALAILQRCEEALTDQKKAPFRSPDSVPNKQVARMIPQQHRNPEAQTKAPNRTRSIAIVSDLR